MSTLGDRIKQLRGTHTQKWLAEQLNIPTTTLSNYENNKSELNFAIIRAFKTIFKVNTDWLLFGNDSVYQGEDGTSFDDDGRTEKLEARVVELEQENSSLKALIQAKEEILEAKEETLRAYKGIIKATQGNLLEVLDQDDPAGR